MEYSKPEGQNYAIFEILNKDDNLSNGMHIVTLYDSVEEPIKIVRAPFLI